MYRLGIHSWGGLGSQLYAVALASEVETRFPSRRICIFVHSSGVTYRSNELIELNPGIELVNIDDFKGYGHREALGKRNLFSGWAKNRRELAGKILSRFGIVGFVEKTVDISQLKPWVRDIRGHYSTLNFREVSLERVSVLLRTHGGNVITNLEEQSFHVIHYRLGDLLTHADKPHIELDRIRSSIQKSAVDVDRLPILLFSDSPKEAFDRISTFMNPEKLVVMESKASEALSYISKSKVFIGTNSKISVWGSILKCLEQNTVEIYIPLEIKHHLQCLLNLPKIDDLNYY